MIREAIQKVVEGDSLSYDEAYAVTHEIMTGSATPSQMSALLVALRMKGEDVEEISGMAAAMRSLSVKICPVVNERLVDTCGTGGDKFKTFNVSTISAFVAAGAGAYIAKHGNRAVSGRCGSADLLEALGVNINVEPSRTKETIEEIGIGFMFAPLFHPAMKNVAGIRHEMGIRTVFNILGPLTNPANAKGQVLGVFDPSVMKRMALSLRRLGTEEALIVHSMDGIDEISVSSETAVLHLGADGVAEMRLKPEDFGLRRASREELGGGDTETSARLAVRILSGLERRDDPKVETVVLNSSAALLVADKTDSFSEGVERGYESIESGAALSKLIQLIKKTGGDTGVIERYGE